MKTALKYCAIACTAIALITSVIFFFFSAKRYSDVKLFENAKGFKSFINWIFYPSGYLILALVFIFLGITAIILLVGEERNKVVHIGTCVVGVLTTIWFLIAFAGGNQFFNRKINGTDTTMGDIKRVEVREKDYNTAKEEFFSSIDGTTVTEDDVARYHKIVTVTTYNKASQSEKDWFDANKETIRPHYGLYKAYVGAEEEYESAKDTYNSHKTSKKLSAVYFCLSLTATIGGAAMVVWTYTKEEE